jgi:hypothetical protein
MMTIASEGVKALGHPIGARRTLGALGSGVFEAADVEMEPVGRRGTSVELCGSSVSREDF